MRIYLDDCADGDRLGNALRSGGHEVFTPRSEDLRGVDDPIHLQHAVHIGCTLLTLNPSDFEALHEEYAASSRSHFGILLVYQNPIRAKNLTIAQIVSAIRNLEASGMPIANAVHNLNHWR